MEKPGSQSSHDGLSQNSQDWKERKSASHSQPAKTEQKHASATTTAKPGLTLAQTIAAQAAETFHDDARSTTSSKSTGSMKTARGTMSSESMHTAYDGNTSAASKASSQISGGSQQNVRKGQRSQGAKPKPPKKQAKQFPKLAPRQLNTNANDSLLLAMSHIVNPSEFYIHLITADIRKLDFLQEELKETYENLTEDFSAFVPAVGMTCVSKYSLDDMWYRVLILDMEETVEPIMAEVSFVYKDK